MLHFLKHCDTIWVTNLLLSQERMLSDPMRSIRIRTCAAPSLGLILFSRVLMKDGYSLSFLFSRIRKEVLHERPAIEPTGSNRPL